jgi:hypothetical protein
VFRVFSNALENVNLFSLSFSFSLSLSLSFSLSLLFSKFKQSEIPVGKTLQATLGSNQVNTMNHLSLELKVNSKPISSSAAKLEAAHTFIKFV